MNFFKAIWSKMSRKAIYAIVWVVIEGLRVKFPSIPLPPTDLVFDIVLALIATHTTTDIFHIISTFVQEWAYAKAGVSTGETPAK